MLVKINSDYIESIDPDYEGQENYHVGEKIKVGNPDSKYYGAKGTYRGIIADNNYTTVYYNIEITSPLFRVMTFAEASKKYDVAMSTLRHRQRDGRFEPGDCRKSGNTWLVTQSAMERLYGDKEEKEMKKVAKESLKEVQDFLELGYTPVEAWVEDFEEGPHGIESLKIEWSDGNQIHSTEANQNLDEPVQCWLYQKEEK